MSTVTFREYRWLLLVTAVLPFLRSMVQSPPLMAPGVPKEIPGPLFSAFAVATLVTPPTPPNVSELEDREELLLDPPDDELELLELYVVSAMYRLVAYMVVSMCPNADARANPCTAIISVENFDPLPEMLPLSGSHVSYRRTGEPRRKRY